MAVLYITEYNTLAWISNGRLQVPQEPPIAEQVVAIGAGSVQSAAFDLRTSFIRIHTDAICSVAIGTNPVAAATKQRLAANQTEYKGVVGGQKIAVITNT